MCHASHFVWTCFTSHLCLGHLLIFLVYWLITFIFNAAKRVDTGINLYLHANRQKHVGLFFIKFLFRSVLRYFCFFLFLLLLFHLLLNTLLFFLALQILYVLHLIILIELCARCWLICFCFPLLTL